MSELHVLNVFTDEQGGHGNPVGVVLGAAAWPEPARQRLATRLGFSETVFVDDVDQGRLQLFTPVREVRFAGHPLVGVSFLLGRLTGRRPRVLRPVRLPEPTPTFPQQGATWIRGSVADGPAWRHERFETPEHVRTLEPPELAPGSRSDERWCRTQCWAWQDEPAGVVRARVFAADFGVVEDEACGTASMLLATRLGRPLTLVHGRGSVVRARPVPGRPGLAEVGGLVADLGILTLNDDQATLDETAADGTSAVANADSV